MFRDVDIGVAQTRPAMPGDEPVHQIEQLFLDQIASAKRYVYCESQYFASRRIAEAIARRLDEPDGPEFVIVNPVTASECWNPSFLETFYVDSLGITAQQGSEADCAFTNCFSEPACADTML